VPRTSAEELRADVEGSLRSLRTDVIDLYWLHRDDPARPVAHFIDELNRFVREGKIRAFGASNWTARRLRDAHLYAKQSGQQGFCANQPYWCLGVAQSRPPGFTGFVKFDADAYRFHTETGLAVIPYTSQANGFFSKLARGDAGLEQHIFHVPANLAAGRVVRELAESKQVAPSAIVLAYLWSSRPFPVMPIIGSRTDAQLTEAFASLAVRLSPAEVARLETASESGLPLP
jgi:aryl-alcohol dehydrogenase-like predicted oxidoreductase